MALRKMVERLRTSVEELDRQKLSEYCSTLGTTPLDAIEPRRPIRAAGEVRTVRIVPRAGAAALEATVSDGRGSITAVFLGRRKVAGITPGRKVVIEGVVGVEGTQKLVYNPVYRLLP